MEQVMGIGGLFFGDRDPQALARLYGPEGTLVEGEESAGPDRLAS
jgi:hypothetical protein